VGASRDIFSAFEGLLLTLLIDSGLYRTDFRWGFTFLRYRALRPVDIAESRSDHAVPADAISSQTDEVERIVAGLIA